MKSIFKRLLVSVTCAAMLQGALIPAALASSTPAPAVKTSVVTPGGITMEYTAIDYKPNTEAEIALLHNSSGIVGEYGTDYYRFSDGRNYFVYRLTGEIGQMAYVVMDIGMEYSVEVSTDNKTWTEVLNFNRDGLFREVRGIDLTSYFEFSSSVYLKISDAVPETGWGGQLRSMRYVTITGPDGELPASKDISEGWKASTGSTVDAGTSVQASAGSKVTFTKEVDVPTNWIGGQLGLSFSWVESADKPTVKVDGKEVESVTTYGNNLTIPLPEGSNGKQVEVEVTATATEDGISGLWNSVRVGFLDMITMPESTWTLDDETRKIQENYLTDPTDLVRFNALAGNFASTLYDGRYGLTSFNGMMRDLQLFYAHDTSRNLVALAMEEVYSPVVRLETIEDLYKGVKGAMVPGGDYEMFLKVDARPKNVRTSPNNAKLLQMVTNQDVTEPFVDFYVTTEANGKVNTVSKSEVTDEKKDDGVKRTYRADDVSALVDVTWPSCMTDQPTTMAFSSSGADNYNIVFTGFQKLGREPANYSMINTRGGPVALSSEGETELEPPEEGYITLAKNEGYYAHPMIITWDVKPQKIIMKTDSGNSVITSLEFVYEGGAKPTLSAVPFEAIDVDLDWAYRVAEHIVSDGTYGANGYDPTYICGTEGLGPGAIAAAAYIFKKYDSPLAKEAEELALKANRAAYEASVTRNHTPSYFLDRVAGAFFLNKMGYSEFVEVGCYYANMVVNNQQPDGTFYYFDPRNVLVMQIANEIIELSSYTNGVQKYRDAVTYTDEGVIYKGETLKAHLFLFGAGDLGYLGHMGDKEAIEHVMRISADSFDDTGVFDCSDINPYFLGWSLKGMMNVQYQDSDKKTIVPKGQAALYDADGNVQILNYPTSYINNPYLYSDYVLVKEGNGDVDGDGSVTPNDALYVLQHTVDLRELTSSQMIAADCNLDGAVNATDALKILQKSVDLIDELPNP